MYGHLPNIRPLISCFLGMVCLFLLATTQAGEKPTTNIEKNIQIKASKGDIRVNDRRYGGSFGTFGMGNEEIEPDDEQPSNGCLFLGGTQHLRLWDGGGDCFSEKPTQQSPLRFSGEHPNDQ